MRHERCGIYQERTALETAVIVSGTTLDCVFRGIISKIGPAASDDRLQVVSMEDITELGRASHDFVRDYASFTLRRKELLKRRHTTTAYIYRNAMRHCGLSCLDHRQYCSVRIRSALTAVGEVDSHTHALVKNAIESSSSSNRYIPGCPGDPLIRRYGSFLRVPSHPPLELCDLAARMTLDPNYVQPYPPADTLDDYAVFHGILEDLTDVGGATMHRVVEFCQSVLENDDTLAGLDYPSTVGRLRHEDLYDAFRRGVSLGNLLAHHFGAIWLTYFHDWNASPSSAGVRLVLGMRGGWPDERDVEMRAYSQRLPAVDLTHEEQMLLRPVMEACLVAVGEAGGASLPRSDAVYREWTGLLLPIRGGALAVADLKAAQWVRTLRFLLYCIRSARIDYANRRVLFIREMLATDKGRVYRYLAAKAVTGVGSDRLLRTSRWFALVAQSQASPRYLGYRVYRLMVNYLCIHLEMVDMNPGYYDIVLFPAYPPLIPVSQMLSIFWYHREELSSIRSVFVSTAVVAAVMITFEKHLDMCLPGVDPTCAMRTLRVIMEGPAVRNAALSEVVKTIVNTFWMDAERSLEAQTRKSFMQRTLNAVCRNSVPRTRDRINPESWLSDHILKDAVTGVRHYFLAHSMFEDPDERVTEKYMRYLTNPSTQGVVDKCMERVTTQVRSIIVWSSRVFSDVFRVHLVREPGDYVDAHVSYIRAHKVVVPPYAVLPDVGDDHAAVDAVAPLIHRVHEVVVAGLRQWILRLNQHGDGGGIGLFDLDAPSSVAAAEPVLQPDVEAVFQPDVEPVFQPDVEPVFQPDVEPVFQLDVVAADMEEVYALLPSLDTVDEGWIERVCVSEEESAAPERGGDGGYFDFSVRVERPSGSGLGLV